MFWVGCIVGTFVGMLIGALLSMTSNSDLYSYEIKNLLHRCVEADWTPSEQLNIRNKASALLKKIYEEE
jgi:hypothetical protein